MASRYTHDLLEVLLRGSESESAIFVSPPTKVSGFCENATEPTKQSKVLGGQFELCFTMSAGSVHSAAASAAAAAGTAKRTFSKNELYAPLQVSAAMKMSKGSSHHNRIDDGGSMLSKVPASIREQSYIKFLCQVSERYHRLSTARAAKKNGDRPMGSADIDPLIQHRSLSLFGGGIHKAIMGKATEPDGPVDLRKRFVQRRRRSRQQQRQWLRGLSNTSTAASRMDLWKAMTELTVLWNTAVLRSSDSGAVTVSHVGSSTRVGIDPSATLVEKDGRSSLALRQSLARTLTDCELVGAPIRILSCRGREAYTGKFGYLVGESAAAWHALVVPKQGRCPRFVVLPKGQATMAVRVFVNRTSGMDNDNDTNGEQDKRDNCKQGQKDQATKEMHNETNHDGGVISIVME